MTNYYKILGLDRSASHEEIKKAYKKLAIRYHPDKNNGDDRKFKKISEAYDTLSDPQKKASYDLGHVSTHRNPFDIFNEFFQHMEQEINNHNFGTNYFSQSTTIINGKKTVVTETLGPDGKIHRKVTTTNTNKHLH